MTVVELQAKVDIWSNCEDSIAKHQSFTIGDKQFRFPDLPEVRKTLLHYEGRLAKAQAIANGRKNRRTMKFVHE